jgi:DNA-directed RNA polymerase beta subunit
MKQTEIEKKTEELQKSTVDALKRLFPIKAKNNTLKLTKVWVDDSLDTTDFQSQFKAKVAERTWGAPVYGSFELTDKSGAVVQKDDKVRLLTLPKQTPRLSYIINGSEHQIANQLRLRPAGYTVRSLTGGVKSQINLSKGYSGQIYLEANPESGHFKLKVGQAHPHLYPILNALGVSDQALSNA